MRAKVDALVATAAGMRQARRILQGERVELVLAFGGYLAAPVVLAAWLLRFADRPS